MRIGVLFAQFSAYHVDRCQAIAGRLGDRAEVVAVEVATTSADYAWEPSGAVAGARKVTLFPGESFDTVSPLRRFRAQFAALRRCDWVLVGIGYNEPDIIALSWALAACGVRVVVLSESKFDDFPRSSGHELVKGLILRSYRAAIVGAQRQIDYMRFLGFDRRPVLPGYDTVGLDRVRAMGGGVAAPDGQPYGARAFVFIGRFVPKKALPDLVDGYAAYVRQAAAPRRLILVGSGPEEAAIRQRADDHGIAHLIDFPGFLGPEAVARILADGLALVLPSTEEQWGLVVNEALAFGLPVIVSAAVGSRDVLVRNLDNGFVIEPGSPEGLGLAMARLADDEAEWRRMVGRSHARAKWGDTERLADAVEALVFGTERASANVKDFVTAMACPLLAQRGRARTK